ncbi:MAG: class D beta-lactamase [Myxococcales bacterium]|nr:class D beta-lactamase [Myxococcales bacterium]
MTRARVAIGSRISAARWALVRAMTPRVLAMFAVAAGLGWGCRGRSSARPAADTGRAVAPVDAPVATIDAPVVALDVGGALAVVTAAVGLPVDATCLVLGDPGGAVIASDGACADVRLRPASTFKIVNTLIGADVGLISGPDAVLRYDPVRYPPAQIANPEWKRDQSVRRALEVSAVPLYRRLALDIGAARMQAHLDALAYGNRSIAGGLDQFWLTGGLAVSAREQVALVAGLLAATLPVTAAAMATVREAVQRETLGDATIHWKTGTGELDDGGWIGWLVGWVDRPDGARPFACWIREPAGVPFETVRDHRMAVCRGALAELRLVPASSPPP